MLLPRAGRERRRLPERGSSRHRAGGVIAFLGAFERFVMRWTMWAAVSLLALCCCVSLFQVITRFVFEEPSLTVPPYGSTFFSRSAVKKPTNLLSGDQKGCAAPAVPAIS